jgi:hypothetical protein
MTNAGSDDRPSVSSASVEIIAIGDELLDGDVLDTNTHWLCRRVTRLGGRVGRVPPVILTIPSAHFERWNPQIVHLDPNRHVT